MAGISCSNILGVFPNTTFWNIACGTARGTPATVSLKQTKLDIFRDE